MDINYDSFYSWWRHILQSVALVVDSITKSTLSLLSQAFPLTVRYPYHTSVLTGEDWVLELLAGHPQWVQTELGVSHHVFQQLTATLWSLGLNNTMSGLKNSSPSSCMLWSLVYQFDTLESTSSVPMEQYHCECILFYSYFYLHLTPLVAIFDTHGPSPLFLPFLYKTHTVTRQQWFMPTQNP
jgi:hypothetical protein